MPIQELERVNRSTFQQYDILSRPDAGGRQEPTNPFKGTMVIARSSDRISPLKEPQESSFPSSGSINFNSDFKLIDSLHTELGIKPGQRLSHDPAMERARYLRVKTNEERQAVKQGVIINMERTLYERAFTSQSLVTYYQDDEGRIYHPDFPGESFDVSLQRGLEFSKSKRFVDYEREEKEFEGWKQVMSKLFDPETPLGSKQIVISGPGLKKGTAFTDNCVDIFTKALDPETGKAVVIMTRFASGVEDYGQYRKIAAKLDGNYFGAEQIQADKEDLYFKEHPIFISAVDSRDAQQLFAGEFKQQAGATEEEKTKNYLAKCQLLILHYAEAVCAELFEPENVKKAFNAVINKFDDLRKGIIEIISHVSKGVLGFDRNVIHQARDSFKSLQEEIDHYARMSVKQLMVGCGLSAGFSIGGFSGGILGSVGNLISNIKDKDYCIRCGACGAKIEQVVRRGGRCPVCQEVRQC